MNHFLLLPLTLALTLPSCVYAQISQETPTYGYRESQNQDPDATSRQLYGASTFGFGERKNDRKKHEEAQPGDQSPEVFTEKDRTALEKEMLNKESRSQIALDALQRQRSEVLKERYFAQKMLKQGDLTPDEERSVMQTIEESNQKLRQSVANINKQRQELLDLRDEYFKKDPDNAIFAQEASNACADPAQGCSLKKSYQPKPSDADPTPKRRQRADPESVSIDNGFFNY